ncbi:GYD domain-containing protein [Mesorhizobium sp. ArgA1]
MAYYVLLSNFTDQGIKSIKDTQKRAEAFKAMASKNGIKVHTLLWTLGQHDVVAIAEADDDNIESVRCGGYGQDNGKDGLTAAVLPCADD